MPGLLRFPRLENELQCDFNTTAFVVAAIFYLLMTLVLTWLFQRLERHYARYDQ